MTHFGVVVSIEIDGQVACSDMGNSPIGAPLDYDHPTMDWEESDGKIHRS